MKTTSSPESYRYCALFTSVRMRWNFSPARNVRSTTAPESMFLTFVRTNAPPLPGLTCWNSTIRQTPPSIPICMPFLNWFVLTISAIASNLVESPQFFRKGRQNLRPVFGDDDEILDPDPAAPGEIDAGLDGHDVALRERAARLLGEARILVDEQAHPMTEPVSERLAEPRRLDAVARRRVDARAGRAWLDGREPRELGVEADVVRALKLVGKCPRRERARAVRAVAVDDAARVDQKQLVALDPPVARMCMRLRAVRAR